MEVIAPNQLEDKLMLGSGAFGSVYKAKWRSRQVAVKYFNSKTIGDDPSFEREIEALTHLQSLKHPNIIRMFARGTEGPQTFMVMEIALFSLDKIIHELKKEYDYNFNHFMSWTLQLALALECCHHNSIIHRDIKPPNMLLFDDGRCLKICDFGTAKLLDATSADTFIGTPYYLAPEVIEGKHSNKCDVYSFAVTLWEMITRHKPTLDLNQEGQPHPYNVFRTIGKGARMPTIIGIPKFLWELVTKCWAQQPVDRLSFDEIVRKLKGVPYKFKNEPLLTRRRSKTEVEKPPPSSDIHQIRRPDSHPPNQMVVAFDPDSFEVVDNFESTSDDTLVSIEPKQANPSSQYYIDGLDPDRQPYIPIEGNQESYQVYMQYKSYVEQRFKILYEMGQLDQKRIELDNELHGEELKSTKSTTSFHRYSSILQENRELEEELKKLRSL
ncbi:PREDICTED: mitogen-activated protein kinase kinase kinase 7-like [Amphimedon queenslandica]|uniref:Protein kinase domain-containing protein n=1 Tax=Amphimedon queenslandica TaxID=400682 RepID=A0AAN0IQ07_AMPQE|nr:PREDICTED: mitogen-activated protein kinase kinase kinase 7-like [Amphimedon queenslandica]|eukprot:XP_011406845.2 PREDICTED: mitogen-activated protein kinase kinase kinase 7-like [Amphimedon queenslandica]